MSDYIISESTIKDALDSVVKEQLLGILRRNSVLNQSLTVQVNSFLREYEHELTMVVKSALMEMMTDKEHIEAIKKATQAEVVRMVSNTYKGTFERVIKAAAKASALTKEAEKFTKEVGNVKNPR